jgi:WD40 repeat protein
MSVRLRNNKIIVLTRNKFYAFNMKTLVTIAIIKTYDNPLGIIATSNGDINNKLIVAFPYESQGHVFLGEITQKCEKLSVVQAHDSKIACISINKDGTLLATASDKGTLIRIFTTNDGQKFSEFRRGTKTVEMNCIAFDPNNKFIGCSSNVGTIHIFSIAAITKALDEKNNKAKNEIEDEPKNSKSFLGKIGGLLNIKNAYLESERSFAKFKVQEENSILGFGSENTFVVITMDGKYYKAAYNPKRGGDCCKIEEKNILNDF